MMILLPTAEQEVYQDAQVAVANFTPFQDMWFRYRYDNGTSWSTNISLEYHPGAGQWRSVDHRWDPGNITLEVFGRNNTGVIHAQTVWFMVQPGDTPFPWLLVGIAAGAVVGTIFIGFIGKRMGWWGRIGRRLWMRRARSDAAKEAKKKDAKAKPKKTKASEKETKKKTGPKKGKEGGR
jgi:hypothetical protein